MLGEAYFQHEMLPLWPCYGWCSHQVPQLPEEQVSLQDAYEAGYDTYLEGGLNPYPMLSLEHDAWERGWSDACVEWNSSDPATEDPE